MYKSIRQKRSPRYCPKWSVVDLACIPVEPVVRVSLGSLHQWGGVRNDSLGQQGVRTP